MASNSIQFNELVQLLTQETEQYGTSLQVAWIKKASALIERTKNLVNKNERVQQLLNSITEPGEILNQLYSVAIEENVNDNLIKDMYRFLNEVGETLRKEKILYRVIITDTKNNKIYDYELNLEQFLTITEGQTARLGLAKATTVMNKMAQAQNITTRIWDLKAKSDFGLFAYNARRVAKGKWAKVNNGNLMEAFQRYQNLRGTQAPTYAAMSATMSAPIPFWQGADYNGYQFKANSASVTNLGSCLKQIIDLRDTLMKLNFTNSALLTQKLQPIQDGLNETEENLIQDTVETLLQNLATQFNFNII